MSDRELHDIGVYRVNIDKVVKGITHGTIRRADQPQA